MGVHLGAGVVNGLHGRTGQFELPARLQAQRRAVLRQADNVFAFAHRLPAEALHAFQQLADARLAVIGDRLLRLEVVDELFVFGADTPVGLGPAAFGKVTNQVVAALNFAAGGLWNGHEKDPRHRYLRTGHGIRKTALFLY